MLATRAGCQVVGEAGDGLEAVQKAADLQPDLVVLDIGLPWLNGLDCARRIRVLAPQSKIIFLSQESSAEVVREALTLACGYVFKIKTTSDLFNAIESAISERQFVGTM
jgi:DNA-binding NarL/FixJ family response regulator